MCLILFTESKQSIALSRDSYLKTDGTNKWHRCLISTYPPEDITHWSQACKTHLSVLNPPPFPTVIQCYTVTDQLPPSPPNAHPTPAIAPAPLCHPTPPLILQRASPEQKQRRNLKNGMDPTQCLGTSGEPFDMNVLTVTQPQERGGQLFYCIWSNKPYALSENI